MSRRKRVRKWIQKVARKSRRRHHVGALHRTLGIPKGEVIPEHLLREAALHPERWEKTARGQRTLRHRAQFALNVGRLRHHRGPERRSR